MADDVRRRWAVWSCLFVIVCLPAVCPAGASSCETAEVVFPNRDFSLHPNNTPSTVHFIINSSCFQRVEIYNNSQSKPLCTIRRKKLSDKVCQCWYQRNNTPPLQCSTQYAFTRSDRQWTIKVVVEDVSSNLSSTTFNVTYPTMLKKFVVQDHENESLVLVEPNTRISLQCSWTQGNLGQRPQLLGPSNQSLTTWTAQSPGRYNVTVMCKQIGRYQCHVTGTDESKSLTVLAKCPLEFQSPSPIPERSVQRGAEATVSFQVTSYTERLSTCQLSRAALVSPIPCNSSRSVLNVVGSPPYLTITVTLKNITEEDEGEWTLDAWNPVQTKAAPLKSQVHFRLSVAELVQKGWSNMHTGIAVAAFVLIILIILIICVVVRRRKREALASKESKTPKKQQQQQQKPTAESKDERMFVNDMYESSAPCRMITNTIYETSEGAAVDGGALYDHVEESGRNWPPPRPPRSDQVGKDTEMYVGQEEIQRNKARNKATAKTNIRDAEEGQVYVGQEEIQRNKSRNKAKKHAKDRAGKSNADDDTLYSN